MFAIVNSIMSGLSCYALLNIMRGLGAGEVLACVIGIFVAVGLSLVLTVLRYR